MDCIQLRVRLYYIVLRLRNYMPSLLIFVHVPPSAPSISPTNYLRSTSTPSLSSGAAKLLAVHSASTYPCS